MKRTIIALPLIAISSYVYGWNNQYEIQTDPFGSSLGGSRDIQMRPKYDYDPVNKFRGTIDSDGSVRMRNYNGDLLRGTIDDDGYGRLRDQDGNTWRVRP